jgi:hypothetical protein
MGCKAAKVFWYQVPAEYNILSVALIHWRRVVFRDKWIKQQAGKKMGDVIRLTSISFLWNHCCQTNLNNASMPFNMAKVSTFRSFWLFRSLPEWPFFGKI